MRRKRIKIPSGAYYHLVSRCAFQQFMFTDEEKQAFVPMMRRVAAFCGLDILTYCVMSNHFHILVRVPPPRPISESELLARVAILYGSTRAKETRARWAVFRRAGLPNLLEQEKSKLRERMGDISPFMHDFKLRFSIWHHAHNKTDGKTYTGTLWDSRFSSTLVEGNGSLAAVAAYIDLNPVRAGIVQDPKDYAFSGYGAAMTGDSNALQGLAGVYGEIATSPDKLMSAYRGLLYAKGADVLTPESSQQAQSGNKQTALPLLLRTKIRAMTRGIVLGSSGFAASLYAAQPDAFGEPGHQPPQTTSLCPSWDGIQLCTIRFRTSAPSA